MRCKPYGAFDGVELSTAVRLFYFRYHTMCGSVRFLFFENRTVRCGAVFPFSKSYGAAGCGAVCGADYIFQVSCGAVRCGYPLNSCFSYGRCG